MIEMKALIAKCCVAITCFASPATFSQTPAFHFADAPYRIAEVKERPDLAVELATVASLKVAVRKKSYVIGEMLIVDAALLAANDKKAFLPTINSVEIFADGKIIPYRIIEKTRPLLPADSNTLDKVSLLYLVGCSEHPFQALNSPDQRNAVKRFEGNLFVSWGSGCLNVKNGDRVSIYAEIQNGSVVVSRDDPNVKSGVGTLRSAPVQIEIRGR